MKYETQPIMIWKYQEGYKCSETSTYPELVIYYTKDTQKGRSTRLSGINYEQE